MFAPQPQGASPSSHSSFCEEVFSLCSHRPAAGRTSHSDVATSRMRWTGQIFWLLALPCSRLHPRNFSGIGPMGSRIQLQQRNCSRFSRDFLRRSTFLSSQRTGSRTTGLRSERQDYLIRRAATPVVMSSASRDISYWRRSDIPRLRSE